MEAFLAPEEKIFKLQHLDNWISGGGDQNCKAKRRYKTTGLFVDCDYNIAIGETNVYKDLWDGIQSIEGLIFRG